ncbi:hypothetical protein BC830DRAFT_1137648, partial [Chytriomyces sp. MP71]
ERGIIILSWESVLKLNPTQIGSVQDDARMKDLNALIDSTRMIANAHQVWAENLGQDVGDPLNRHLGDIMLTVKARQDKNKARIEGLVTKLHDEEDHSYKLSKKKQRDLVMLQEVRIPVYFRLLFML